MTQEILVPIAKHDRINDVLPYLEEIARPGMRVVFLIRYPADGFYSSLARLEIMQTGVQMRLSARKIAVRYAWDEQRRIAEERVSPARKALQKKGVETAVDLYTDSLRTVVKSYTRKGDVQLVIVPAGMGLNTVRFLHGTAPFLSFFAKSGFSPVLVERPHHV